MCEGHGDLRAEQICSIDDIEIFDCIEFDEALRYSDVAGEIAFLSMDLDFSGHPDFAATIRAREIRADLSRTGQISPNRLRCHSIYNHSSFGDLSAAASNGGRKEYSTFLQTSKP